MEEQPQTQRVALDLTVDRVVLGSRAVVLEFSTSLPATAHVDHNDAVMWNTTVPSQKHRAVLRGLEPSTDYDFVVTVVGEGQDESRKFQPRTRDESYEPSATEVSLFSGEPQGDEYDVPPSDAVEGDVPPDADTETGNADPVSVQDGAPSASIEPPDAGDSAEQPAEAAAGDSDSEGGDEGSDSDADDDSSRPSD